MKRISMAIAVLGLAALIHLESFGQQTQEQLPPLKADCQAADNDFVKGQNLEIRCTFLIKENVTLDIEGLRQAANENFSVIELSSTKPVPIPNDKDYNAVFSTQVFRPNTTELEYGRYGINLELSYSYPEVRWEQTQTGQRLITEVKNGVEKIPEIIFEKKPLIARIEDGEGFQNVVNIGEHILYALRIFYEKDATTLLNGLSPVELEQKYGIKDATRLDNPDFNPFVVINRNEPLRKEIDRGLHMELVYEYHLALYEVSSVKTFNIPRVNLYYLAANMDGPVHLATQNTVIRTNSVLNRDSDFRPLKNILKPAPDKLELYGNWPLRTAYAATVIAGLIILHAFLVFLIGRFRKTRHLGLYATLLESKARVTNVLNSFTLVAWFKTKLALEKLASNPSQANLKRFINQLRLYFGTLIKIPGYSALSFTAEEFRLTEFRTRKVIGIEILDYAEELLDEEMASGDLYKLSEMFKKLKKIRR